LKTVLVWLDRFNVRWISPALTAAVSICAFVASYDFSEFSKSYDGLSTVWNFLSGNAPDFALLIVGPLSIASALRVRSLQPSIKSLEDDRDFHKSRADKIGETILIFFDGVLLNFSRKLKFNDDSTIRISIYLHHEKEQCFIPCGRYSSNPVLQKKGRTRFPDTEGSIAKAWQAGWHFDNLFPENDKERKKYNFKHYSIPESSLKSLKMQTRLIATHRVRDFDHRPIAVIVVESTRNDAFSEEHVKALMSEEAIALGKMMHDLKEHIPTPQEAESWGL
jgi:hypothetical protein